jgi:hypothetical protein
MMAANAEHQMIVLRVHAQILTEVIARNMVRAIQKPLSNDIIPWIVIVRRATRFVVRARRGRASVRVLESYVEINRSIRRRVLPRCSLTIHEPQGVHYRFVPFRGHDATFQGNTV